MSSIRDWDLIQRLGSSLYRSVTLSSALPCSSCPFCVLYCTNFLQKQQQQPLISDTTTQSFLSTRSLQLSLSLLTRSQPTQIFLSLSLSLCNFFFQVESRHFCFFSASVIERGKLFTLRFLRILPKMPWLAVNENVFYCLGEKEKNKDKKNEVVAGFFFWFCFVCSLLNVSQWVEWVVGCLLLFWCSVIFFRGLGTRSKLYH